ncbi:MAG: hypothetical protein PUC32_06360 [Oscillospiraceae bacterium]|nr:hypothetical protein [Oscillospiraceae bacterium]
MKKRFGKKLFGNTITPSCSICRHNETPELSPTCPHAREGRDHCRRFSYDPLLRKPKALPPLQQYSDEDFSLSSFE